MGMLRYALLNIKKDLKDNSIYVFAIVISFITVLMVLNCFTNATYFEGVDTVVINESQNEIVQLDTKLQFFIEEPTLLHGQNFLILFLVVLVFTYFCNSYFIKNKGKEFAFFTLNGATLGDRIKYIMFENSIFFLIGGTIGTVLGFIFVPLSNILMYSISGHWGDIWTINLYMFKYTLLVFLFEFGLLALLNLGDVYRREPVELLNLNNEQIDLLIELRRKNSSLFTKWQSLSIKAMREIIPDLYERNVNQMNILTERGVFKDKLNLFENSVYLPKEPVLEEIYNPVVRRSISITIDALNALIKKYGYPEDIVIEMPRDRNDAEQKDRIKKFQKTRENELKNIKKKIKEEYGIEITDEHFRKHKGLELELKLWVEQNEKCPYSGKHINVQDILYHHELFEIDHIIPLSIS